MVRIRPADPPPPEQVRLIRPGIDAARVMEYLADLDAETPQLLTGGRDVGDDKVEALCRAGRGPQ